MSAFGNGSNSNGNFWYGNSTNFPGFLYKKNVGVGARRSTKMGPGGNITCNSATDLYNKYKPGVNGVGASTTSNRRAKNRLASVCGDGNSQCGAFYQYLGRYDNYTSNPNGFFNFPLPVPVTPRIAFRGQYVTSVITYLSQTYNVATFTGNGTVIIQNLLVNYIVVGGGGGGAGGSYGGGGGGGGGAVVSGSFFGNSTYNIIVGAGGLGGDGQPVGTPGPFGGTDGSSSKIFGVITAAGGFGVASSSFYNGGNSGNGGLGGVGNTNPGGNGTNGGAGGGGEYFYGVGGNGSVITTPVPIYGTDFGAGGGGGAGDGGSPGNGGNSYAGNGNSGNGTANYGGGGGGGASGGGSGGGNGGNGGSGVVIFYWPA